MGGNCSDPWPASQHLCWFRDRRRPVGGEPSPSAWTLPPWRTAGSSVPSDNVCFGPLLACLIGFWLPWFAFTGQLEAGPAFLGMDVHLLLFSLWETVQSGLFSFLRSVQVIFHVPCHGPSLHGSPLLCVSGCPANCISHTLWSGIQLGSEQGVGTPRGPGPAAERPSYPLLLWADAWSPSGQGPGGGALPGSGFPLALSPHCAPCL